MSSKPQIEVTPRQFTITLSEFQAQSLVHKLKFKSDHRPQIVGDLIESLEESFGFEIEDTPDI